MSLGNVFGLLKNELLKTYIRKSTWVMYGVILALIIGSAVLTAVFDDVITTDYSDNWREELTQENEQYIKDAEEFGFEDMYASDIAKNNYYLENDIQPTGYKAWQFTLDNAMLASLISLFTIIIGAGIVSSEFKWGTIKLLLIRPISRTTILFTKFLTVLLFAFATLVFTILLSLIVGSIFFGFEGINPYFVLETVNGFEYVSLIAEVFQTYGYSMVTLVMMTAFAFMISTIFRNSSLAIGLAIFLMFSGNMIVAAFSDYKFAKYILFANTNLKQYETGHLLFDDMTLGFSVVVLIVYFVLFLAVSWLSFNKRDVAGH
ncbi:ABC transporter permease [Gracilibacillus marinus]|jgi:ABC-2 type transport system permease protein|uniref:ABC transporter permease n=1 Tax=Gracilibacillus marinus TaxID=630535 RepID=A0ABV8W1H8_9BACI